MQSNWRLTAAYPVNVVLHHHHHVSPFISSQSISIKENKYSRPPRIPIPTSPALVKPQLARRAIKVKRRLAHVALGTLWSVDARVLHGAVEEVGQLAARSAADRGHGRTDGWVGQVEVDVAPRVLVGGGGEDEGGVVVEGGEGPGEVLEGGGGA